MPGLTGMITARPDEQRRKDLQLMMQSLKHGPLDRTGTYINDDLGVYVGWACHPSSFVDCMPIWNEDRDKCLFFFGEDFQDNDVEEQLKSDGHTFASGNASYLVHLYEQKGSKFFRSLNGFFHGLFIDFSERSVSIFNDRFGMQRLYLSDTRDGLFFSAEAKSLLRVRPELREWNYPGLGQLLTMGCVLGEETLYKGISLLPAASLWRFHKGTCWHKSRYFCPSEWENQSVLSGEAFYGALRETFAGILPRYYRDVENLGVSLTGGLDTRLIMAHAPRSPSATPCYTFGSMYRDGFDVRVARQVAAVCGQNHHTIGIGKQFLDEFPDLARNAAYISDGYIDVASGSAELFANRHARKLAPIRMTGSHGSEVLRGVSGFRYKLADQDVFDDEIGKYMSLASGVFEETKTGNALTFAAFVEAPRFNYNRISLEQSQLVKRSPFMDNELMALVYRAPAHCVSTDRLCLQLVKDGNPELARINTNRGVGGVSEGLATRFRQTYHEVLKLAEFGYDHGMPQPLSRIDALLRPFQLERVFLGWNGFYHFRKWLRDELSDYVEEILLDPRTLSRPYYRKGAIERIVAGHIHGGLNFGRAINSALSLELAHRTLLEGD
jgi:asparagine synthase (glutamine-hydrolysing)